jgi:ABC-type sugar transport system substrate-binding protein
MVRPISIVGLTVVGVVALGACGGSSSDTSTSSSTSASSGNTGSGASDAAAAAKRVAPYLKPATSIIIDVPLTKAPPKGLTVAFVNGNLAAQQTYTPGFKQAAGDLGWNLQTFTYDNSNPQSINAAVQQAVSRKVDYIITNGIGSAAYTQALAAAKAAKIPLVQANVVDEPDASSKGILACVGCKTTLNQFQSVLNDWMISDSNGTANATYVGISEFPANPYEGQFDKTYISQHCSGCKADELYASASDLAGGKIPALIVAYLQKHPNVNYLNFGFGQIADGVRQAMDSAGVGKNVKLVCEVPDLELTQQIIDGKFAAGLPLAVIGQDYQIMDAIARDSVGMDVSATENALTPTELWTKSTVPQPAQVWNGPPTLEAQYKQLWKVS